MKPVANKRQDITLKGYFITCDVAQNRDVSEFTDLHYSGEYSNKN